MVATQNRIQQKFTTQVGNLLVLKLTHNALHTQFILNLLVLRTPVEPRA